MDWLVQSIREYHTLHGAPPSSLTQLPVSPGDLSDVWGHPIQYRVSGTPARGEIRSAGEDGSLQDSDPWIPAS